MKEYLVRETIQIHGIVKYIDKYNKSLIMYVEQACVLKHTYRIPTKHENAIPSMCFCFLSDDTKFISFQSYELVSLH